MVCRGDSAKCAYGWCRPMNAATNLAQFALYSVHIAFDIQLPIQRFSAPSTPSSRNRPRAKKCAQSHREVAKSVQVKSRFWGTTLTPPWPGDESARSRTRWLLDRKPWHKSNGVRAIGGQTARSASRKCAESNAHEKGRDALPLTFVSSWSTKLAAGLDDVLPQERRSRP